MGITHVPLGSGAIEPAIGGALREDWHVAVDDHPFRRDPAVVTHPDVEGPPLTDQMIVRAEEVLGRSLPPSYVDAMRRCNGGYLRDTCVGTSRPTSWAADHVSISSIFGVPAIDDDGSFGTGSGVLCTPYMISEWGLPPEVVLLDGDGHTWTALDYRTVGQGDEPSVVWLDVELGEELRIATSFSDLLGRLRPESDFPEEHENIPQV